MKPVTGESPVREMFPTAVEVAVWVDFGDAKSLGLAARALEVEFKRDPDLLPEPEPGRRYYALVWPCGPDDFTGAPEPGWFIDSDEDDLATLWTNAYLLGIIRGAWLLAVAGEAGIGGRIFAVRVQQEGARFPDRVQYGDGGPVL